MAPKVAVSIIVLLLPLAGLILSREGLSHKQRDPGSGSGELLTKLGIQKFDKPTPAPNFTLKDLHGRPVSLRDLRGRVVFLNFWATWCPPCRLEMPTMEELHGEFGNQGLVILAINFREGPEEVKAFFEEHHLTFKTLLDREAEAFGLYEAWSLPVTYLINKKGEIVGKVIGYRDWHNDLARSLFRQLLDGNA